MALEKLHTVMIVGNYSNKTYVLYSREIRLLLNYYPDIPADELTQDHILKYIRYIKEVHQASYSKTRLFAMSCQFFFKNVIQKECILPPKIYPRKEHKLPLVMPQDEMLRLFAAIPTFKNRLILQFIYSCGIRLEELQRLEPGDIDSKNMRIYIRKSKGNRDRYTVLSQKILDDLRLYYLQYRPVKYLFNGRNPGSQMSSRNLQWIMKQASKKAGLNQAYHLHTLRHSFATHLVEHNVNIHTIKELLGHANIKTTMGYLHLQTNRISGFISPIDQLKHGKDV